MLQVSQLPSVSGRPCPGPTVEYTSCDYPCQNFAWSPGPWSQCHVVGGRCGRGRRRRSVRCVERVAEEAEMIVLENFCDNVSRPGGEEECDDPCPGHCVLGEWSQWTRCQEVTYG